MELDEIPTECRRCHKIFDDSELQWVTLNRNEMWFVCVHCKEAINWANNMIALLNEQKKEFSPEGKQ